MIKEKDMIIIDQIEVMKYPLKYFCADVSWISKFHNECEFLMPPAFIDTKKHENSIQPIKKKLTDYKCYVIETDTLKRVQR